MGFLGEDPFDEMIQGFFGGNGRRIQNNSRIRNKIPGTKVDTCKKLFFIFDFSGEENLKVEIKDYEQFDDYGNKTRTKNKSLEIKNNLKVIGEYILPEQIKIKSFDYTFKNGILEVSFKK
jgi:HSP20 family molecular chaperone IbpA